MKQNIILIYSIYFKNIIDVIKKHLTKKYLDYYNIIIHDDLTFDDSENLYIIFNLKSLLKYKLPKKYIVFNFEQLESLYKDDNYYIFFDKLLNSTFIYDYSINNVNYLKKIGINHVSFLPYSWHYELKIKNLIPINDRINKFLFIGSINKRRVDFLRPMHKISKELNLNMFISDSTWNEEYDYILQNSVLGINVHFYEEKTILEVHRIIPYIINKIIVITERSSDTYYDNLFNDLVTFVDSEKQFIETIHHYLNSLIELESIVSERQRKLLTLPSYNQNLNIVELNFS